MLSKFDTNFASIIEGRGGHSNANSTSGGGTTATTTAPGGISHKQHGNHLNELFGGARVSYIFTEIFASSLISVGAFDGLTNDEIRTTICNANGTRPALFVPEISFDILVKRQVCSCECKKCDCSMRK